MVLVYLYLDPIYVNVNPITLSFLDLDLEISHITPSQVQHSSLSSSAIIHASGESTPGDIQRLYNTNTSRKIRTIDTNSVPAPINEGVWR